MMKHRHLVLAAAALVAASAMADQRSENEARLLAQQFIAAQRYTVAPQAEQLKLVSTQTVRRAAARAKQQVQSSLQTPYYIYNNPNGGFVIVSGTTALEPIIASSATGSIDVTALPDGLSYWLGYAAEAAKYAEEHPEAAAVHPAKAPRRYTPGTVLTKPDYSKDVKPLLENSPIGNIQWAQDAPYNDQCPVKGGMHCYTGCMATAMSQVMAYHQYPKSYDWSEILASYDGGKGTSSQKSEVARLNHDVGVALRMEYGTDQSGSVSTMYSKALRDQFGYNENVELINRDNFTYGEWMDILLNEFAQNRPVVYDGVSNDGGHAFVIDGYRASDGFVHVNWGWAGMSDGYYNIIMLDPQQTGIGAVLSSGFTSYQDMVVGIEPDRSKDLNYYSPIQGYAMQGELSVGTGYAELAKGDRNGYITLQYMPNLKPEAFSGEFGALFVDASGQQVGMAKAGTVSAAASTMSSNPHATFSGGNFTIPELPDGVYRVYCYIKDNSTGKWAVARTAIDKPNFMVMTQSNGRAFFEISAHHPTGLKASDWSFETGEIKYGTTGLQVTITNTGDEIEYGSFAFSIDVPNQLSRNFYNEFHRFLPGQSETLTLPVLFDEYGEYVIRGFDLYRLNGGGQAEIVEPMTLKFNVNRTLAETLNLLDARVAEVQNVLDRSRLSGNYPADACDALQKAIDDVKNADKSSLDVDGVNALIEQLNAALKTFYQSVNSGNKEYVGFVTGQNSEVNTSWTPGGTKPVYFGMSQGEDDLSAYVGGQIIGLRCLFGRNTTWSSWSGDDMTAKVFLLDYNGYPGDRILATSGTFYPTYGSYTEYLFDEPYTIGAGGVLCVAEVTTKMAGMYGAMGATNNIHTNGAVWMNNGGGWEDMYNTYGNEAHAVAIQAIIVGGGSVNDAKLSNVVAKSVAVGDDVTVSGNIQNLCSSTISSYELTWSDDTGRKDTKTFTKSIAKRGTTEFSFTVPAFETAKLHTIRVAVTKVNDAADDIPSNSTVDITVPVTAHQYTRNVVLEELTGADCGFCPRGITTFEYMKEKYGDEFIGVSIHNFNTTGSDSDLYYHGSTIAPLLVYLSSAPCGMFNRGGTAETYTQMYKADVEAKFLEQQRTCIAQITGSAVLDATTRSLSVTTDTEFGYDYSGGNYRIGYAILEDGCDKNGKGYTQQNYFANSSYGLGALDGWELKGSRVTGVIYDDVFREFLPAYDGQAGSIPAKGQGGVASKYTYTCSLPATVKNVNKVRVIPMIIDANTHEVLNAVNLRPTVEGEDGINTVLRPIEDAPVYDLSGRRTSNTNGVRIVNGRKIIK